MQLTFVQIAVKPSFALAHTRDGGRSLRAYWAEAPAGFVRVLLAEEPMKLNPPREFELHMSVSFSDCRDDKNPPTRRVTDSECRAAMNRFVSNWEEDFHCKGMVRHFYAPISEKKP